MAYERGVKNDSSRFGLRNSKNELPFIDKEKTKRGSLG